MDKALEVVMIILVILAFSILMTIATLVSESLSNEAEAECSSHGLKVLDYDFKIDNYVVECYEPGTAIIERYVLE